MNLLEYAEQQHERHALIDLHATRSTEAQDSRWISYAHEALQRCAETMPEFTSDDVIAVCEMTATKGTAWGGVFRSAARKGMIADSGRYRMSDSPTCHHREKKVWVSLVYGR